MEEKELLTLSKNGDEDAFAELIKISIEKSKSVIYANFNNLKPEDLKDATQVASMKAFLKLKDFREDALFSTWFFTILRNEILNILKVKNIFRERETSIEEMSASFSGKGFENEYNGMSHIPEFSVLETALTILEKQDEINLYKKMIQDVLLKLNPSHTEMVKLVFEEGKSYKEIAEELNIPLGTVMSRIYFARKNAQKLIKQYAQRNNIQLSYLGKS